MSELIRDTRSGFVEGSCPKCHKPTFSKGKTSKHKCRVKVVNPEARSADGTVVHPRR